MRLRVAVPPLALAPMAACISVAGVARVAVGTVLVSALPRGLRTELARITTQLVTCSMPVHPPLVTTAKRNRQSSAFYQTPATMHWLLAKSMAQGKLHAAECSQHFTGV
jgi:hypothetical protein